MHDHSIVADSSLKKLLDFIDNRKIPALATKIPATLYFSPLRMSEQLFECAGKMMWHTTDILGMPEKQSSPAPRLL